MAGYQSLIVIPQPETSPGAAAFTYLRPDPFHELVMSRLCPHESAMLPEPDGKRQEQGVPVSGRGCIGQHLQLLAS